MGIQEHFTHNELDYILLYVCLGVRQLWGPPIWPRNFLEQFILSSSAPEDDSIDLWTHSVVYKRMCKGSFKSSITFPCVPNQRFVGFFFSSATQLVLNLWLLIPVGVSAVIVLLLICVLLKIRCCKKRGICPALMLFGGSV